jgi:hypothetical protein
MKLRRESVENGDFSGPEGAFKNRFSGLQAYRDTFRSENRFLNRKSAVIGARSSWLHEKCGLEFMYISLDIGGTKLMVAAFSEKYEIIAREKADTPHSLSEGISLNPASFIFEKNE